MQEKGYRDKGQFHFYLGPMFSNTPPSSRDGSINLQRNLGHYSADVKSRLSSGVFWFTATFKMQG